MANYTARNWEDYPETDTPITADELNRIDKGVEDAFKAINQVSAGSSEGIESAKEEILDKLIKIENQIDTDHDDIQTLIFNSEDRIKDTVTSSEENVTFKFGDLDNKADLTEFIKSKIGDLDNDVDLTLFIKSKLGDFDSYSDLTAFITGRIGALAGNIENVGDKVDNAQETLSDKLTGTETNLTNQIESVRAELGEKCEELREEFSEKHEILLEQIEKSAKTILRAFTQLSDELAVGDGSISGQGVLVMQGTISNSTAGKDEYNEQEQSD